MLASAVRQKPVKRDKRLPEVRLTEDEQEIFKKRVKESGLSQSEYQRRACLDGCIVTPMPVVNFEFIRELKSIGVNLNQQQRKLNATGQLNPPEARRVLAKIESLLDTLL